MTPNRKEIEHVSSKIHKIIDGDGHVVEDHAAIGARMPDEYRDRFGVGRGAYPPNDHLHAANAHFLPPGAFARVGREGWIEFMEDVGLTSAVLYPTNGLSFGRIVSRDWPIELARAYNDWLHDEFPCKSPLRRWKNYAASSKSSGFVARCCRARVRWVSKTNWGTSATGRSTKKRIDSHAVSASTAGSTITWDWMT